MTAPRHPTVSLRPGDVRSLEILYRMWDELVRDLADWIIRSESLEAKATGTECVAAAARRTDDYERLMRSWGLKPWAAPALPENYAQLLVAMSEAPSPEAYFASIPLFWDVALGEAAREWVEEAGLTAQALRRIVKPAMGASAGRRLVRRHFRGPEREAQGRGWASHLVDCLSQARALDPSPHSTNDEDLSDYRLAEGVDFFMDPRFSRSESEIEDSARLLHEAPHARDDGAERGAQLRSRAARLVVEAEMAALAIFENWRAHLSAGERWENEAARGRFRRSMIRTARTGLGGFKAALAALAEADRADPPAEGATQTTPIAMKPYREFRALGPRERLAYLETQAGKGRGVT